MEPGRATRPFKRRETISDAAFAVAVVLAVATAQLPHAATGGPRGVWAAVPAYGLGLPAVGLHWARRRFVDRIFVRADVALVALDLLFLITVCLPPFAGRTLADRLVEASGREAAAVVYALALALPAAIWIGAWLYSVRAGLVDRAVDPAWLGGLTRRYALTLALYLAAAALAALDWRAGLALAGLATAAGLRSPPAPVYMSEVQEIRPRRRPA
jgi:uncharacterized membrane protein